MEFRIAKVAKMSENWKLSNDLDWVPNTPGKGMVLTSGEVYTWSDSGNPNVDLMHIQYAREHGINANEIMSVFYIDPDGGIRAWGGDTIPQNVRQIIGEADPRLNVGSESWKFTNLDSTDLLDWEEGNEGKGLIARDGSIYTWNDEDFDVHAQFLEQHPEIVPQHYLIIHEDGKVESAGLGEPLDQIAEDRLSDADPRLYVDHSEANTWNFAL